MVRLSKVPPSLGIYGNEKIALNLLSKMWGKRGVFTCTVANTLTSTIPGVSEAGDTPELTLFTGPADAEMLACGRTICMKGIPVNPGGSTHYIHCIPGDVPNYISIPSDSKTHIQQVCSKSSVAALEKDEQENAESGSHNGDALDAVREFLCEEVLRESEQFCESASDNAK